VKLLEAGINVVTTTVNRLIYPDLRAGELARAVDPGATAGGASLYASGIEPGSPQTIWC